MTINPPRPTPDAADLPLSTVEFITLAALLTCLTALSIDIMLPVLPELATDLGVSNPNDRQWVVTSYLIGLVFGQIFVGTIADRYGRLPVLFAGLALFIAGAAVAASAGSFTSLLVARALQGIGGAAPRIVVTAVVRDLFKGRQMARVMSLVMTTFIMVPVFAPSLGQVLAFAGGWRTPISFLALIGCIATLWAWFRLPETSPRHGRQRDRSTALTAPVGFFEAFASVFRSRISVGYVAANGFMFACLMSYILSSQQIFVDIYALGPLFPVAFGAIAIAMALAGILNSRIVVRLGMRTVSHRALVAFTTIAIVLCAISFQYDGRPPFWVLWCGLWLQFFFFGLIVSNFNAIAIEPLGRVAGTASSAMGSYTTFAGAGFGMLVGQAFNMTTLPINIGFVVFSVLALIIVVITERDTGFGREPAA